MHGQDISAIVRSTAALPEVQPARPSASAVINEVIDQINQEFALPAAAKPGSRAGTPAHPRSRVEVAGGQPLSASVTCAPVCRLKHRLRRT